jgi:hypothetical protein
MDLAENKREPSPSHQAPYRFRAKVWLYQGPAAWHFVTLPKKVAAHIKSHHGWRRLGKKGWGSLKVTVTVGRHSWKTSIFPDKGSGSYVLPLKEIARVLGRLKAGKTGEFTLKMGP